MNPGGTCAQVCSSETAHRNVTHRSGPHVVATDPNEELPIVGTPQNPLASHVTHACRSAAPPVLNRRANLYK